MHHRYMKGIVGAMDRYLIAEDVKHNFPVLAGNRICILDRSFIHLCLQHYKMTHCLIF